MIENVSPSLPAQPTNTLMRYPTPSSSPNKNPNQSNHRNNHQHHQHHHNYLNTPVVSSDTSLTSSDSDSNLNLSYDQSSIRYLLTRKCELCARAANKFFQNQSKFQRKHTIGTVTAIFLSFVSGVFGFAHTLWGEELGVDGQNTIIFVSAVMSLLASTIYAIVHAYGWDAQARESQLAAVMYSKTHTDIILALSAENLNDTTLTSITKDLEYIAQMTPNIYEKFILDSSCTDCSNGIFSKTPNHSIMYSNNDMVGTSKSNPTNINSRKSSKTHERNLFYTDISKSGDSRDDSGKNQSKKRKTIIPLNNVTFASDTPENGDDINNTQHTICMVNTFQNNPDASIS